MEISYYDVLIPEMTKMMKQLNAWLDKTAGYADSKKIDMDVFLNSRLAPNQYHFIKQVQVASDMAKGAAARLTGQTPPKFEDTEKTLTEVRERINKTVSYLETIRPEGFAKAASAVVPLGFMPGKAMRGQDYALHMILPNFYFHITTAYAILRHNGVDLGKADFMGNVPLVDL